MEVQSRSLWKIALAIWAREKGLVESGGGLQNLVVHGVDGVLMSLLGCMGWGFGRILGGVGRNFQVIPDLRWEIAPRLVSGIIYGVGIWPLKKLF